MGDCLSCESRLVCYEELAKESRDREKLIEYYKAQVEGIDEDFTRCMGEASALRKDLNTALLAINVLRQAIRLTQEYVGDELLPPIEGWDWYDALRATQSYDK